MNNTENTLVKREIPRWLIIACLIIAGELIFGLLFHVIRYFRPTLLEVFQFTNTEVGDAIGVYGITALISYFAGGVIADRFPARKLMSVSLVATSLGGVWMLSIPGLTSFSILYGYWGITTILLFWSALLRATREWGGKKAQGKAFGLLDGGRGLVGAGAASVAVFLLSWILPGNFVNIPAEGREHALKAVIGFYTVLTLLSAVLIWIFIPNTKFEENRNNSMEGVNKVLKSRYVWLQAIIVVCAYCGYRGIDFYSLYSVEVLGMNEVDAAKLVSNGTYLRPVGAITAGYIADRLTSGKTILIIFVVLIVGYLFLWSTSGQHQWLSLIHINLVITFLAVYALRGVYFALFEEIGVPNSITGTNIGLVSLVGFTPDIFFHSIAGRILDANPGVKGYQDFYLFLIVFAFIGLLAAMLITKKGKII